MLKMVEIFWEDLTKEAQKKVTEVLGISDPREYNWDVFPLAIVTKEEEEET